jgi:hypothetical protein
MYFVEFKVVTWNGFYIIWNRRHALANNGSWDSIMGIVTGVQVVKLSSVGSIPSRGIPYNRICRLHYLLWNGKS